ncbi:hypothetical protein EJM73_19265 [Clostridium botulinum]|uniref:hypothetical protein n=1 Tax=Clostridium botulinum TaxID=1491 RepID=UPI001375D321|nr:hypothetical protein [Clostridium botulinum]NCI21997.1 hypothetical protein [Clostridium botulinum]NCI37752.1 hypothetical protein [Clostridium botulinum]NCI74322.1 hypothetical protein [Clostridium botulinum]NDI40572.1 hypothetical protein [Clostridium botulinum]
MEYLGIEKFGVFVVNGTVPPLPGRPWFTGYYPGNLSERGHGDIRTYNEGEQFSIANSSASEDRHVTWIHIKDGSKHLYISDRVLLTDITWDKLNEFGMIYGTPVTIDGKEYKLRVLTGGVEKNPDSPGTLPTDNEWDTIIQNTANTIGLPKPTTEDLTDTNTYGQLDGKHNDMWNWWGINTICQEARTGFNHKVTRGYKSAVNMESYDQTDHNKAFGWRPALERIEIDLPGKPIPVYPTSEDKTHPEPVKGEITLQTKYNGDGYLEQMEVLVYNYTQQKFEYQTGWIDNTTGAMQLPVTFKAGNNYKITVRHKGTGGIAKGWLELYVIGGELGKYKISEPITVKQFDPIKSYTGGENLIIKPQQFPETENSKIRLVPKTMNSIQAGKTTTTKELEFSASTKTPVIGDKLIKDKDIYTLANVTTQLGEYHTNQPVVVVDDISSRTLFWGHGYGKKSCLFRDRIYIAYINESTRIAYLISTDLAGKDVKRLWTISSTDLRSISITQDKDTVYTVVAKGNEILLYAHSDDKQIITKVISAPNIRYTHITSTMDSRNNYLVLATRETYTSGSTSVNSMKAYWVNVSNLDNVTVKNTFVIEAGTVSANIGTPVVVDTKSTTGDNIKLIYAHKPSDKVGLFERTCSFQSLSDATMIQDLGDIYASAVTVFAQEVTEHNGTDTVAVLYLFQDSSSVYKLMSYFTTAEGVSPYKQIASTSNSIMQYQVTYSKEQGFTAVYSILSGVMYKSHIKNISDTWSSVESIDIFPSRGAGALFECVNLNPISYGKYPGLLILNQEEALRKDSLIFKADYVLRDSQNIIELDKPITTQAGETIKFLDYDLEVKAGEETATVTPTTITEDYYEYEAEFGKKQEERKVTVVGRNSKLTTLYYYNY